MTPKDREHRIDTGSPEETCEAKPCPNCGWKHGGILCRNTCSNTQEIGDQMTASDHLKQHCKHCQREIFPPTNEVPYWHDSDKFGAIYCVENCEHHEPQEENPMDHLKHRTGSLGGDQIPEDLKDSFKQATARPLESDYRNLLVVNLIERIAKAEAAIAQKTRECEELQNYSKYCEKHESECKRGHLKSASCVRCLLTKATEMRLAAEAQVEQLGRQVAEMREAKDGAYSERDKLVALLSKAFPAWLERHPDTDTTWDDDWRWIVFMNIPDQVSWHIHDSELWMFDHLERREGNSWDGHTTPEKYARCQLAKGTLENKDTYQCPKCKSTSTTTAFCGTCNQHMTLASRARTK